MSREAERDLLFPGISHRDAGYGDPTLLQENSVPLSSVGCDGAATQVVPRAQRGMTSSLTSWVLGRIQKLLVFENNLSKINPGYTLSVKTHTVSSTCQHTLKNLAVRSRW